jgi:hypothetical protein
MGEEVAAVINGDGQVTYQKLEKLSVYSPVRRIFVR